MLAPGVVRRSTIIARQAQGCWLTDVDGASYLDMTSGIGALSTGHSHPRVVQAVRRQVGQLVHAQQNCVATHPPQQRLLEALRPTMPEEVDTFFFTSSGSEAVENAIKLCRKATGRPNLISFVGGFHGRTLGCMSVSSSRVSCRQGYQPLLPGVFSLEYPTMSRVNDSIRQLDELLQRATSPDETAAVLLEPVLGEGGVRQADPRFVRHLRETCSKHGILWVSDEVQTGVGRTGKWWGYEHFGVEPDVVVFGKGVASGFPLAGVAAAQRHFATIQDNGLGGTYNGNVVATEAACATLEVMHREKLVERSRQMGPLLAAALRGCPLVRSVRQYGLMLAAEMDLPPEEFNQLLCDAQHAGLMLLSTGTGTTIRLLPPLIISADEITEFKTRFTSLLQPFLPTS